MDRAIFSSVGDELASLLQSPIIRLGRYFIASDDRTRFSANRLKIKHLFDDFAKPHQVKDPWKIQEPGKEQEFVFICGWPTVKKHMEFANTEGFTVYIEAHSESARRFDLKHYQRLL